MALLTSSVPLSISKPPKAYGLESGFDINVPADTPFEMPDDCVEAYLRSHKHILSRVENNIADAPAARTIPELVVEETIEEDLSEGAPQDELGIVEVTPLSDTLDKLDISQLRQKAQELGITFASNAKKATLIKLLVPHIQAELDNQQQN